MTNPDTPQDETQENELTNVHQALQEAALTSKAEVAMRNRSIRFPDDLWEETAKICERNATDVPTFLRECCKGLCRDYGHKE